MEVDLVVQTSNLELAGSPGRRVMVPANDRVEVRFPARTNSPGIARFRAVAVSGDHADAQIVALPVYTPATSEAFATYGVVDEGAVVQSIAALRDVIPQFGGLEINTSSTALQALTDAVLYLFDYRYASSDAYASRILAISALRDVLGAFEAEGLGSPDELDATVRRDIAELSALQNSDGGFGWWSRNRPSSPYQSIQAMHALIVAQKRGLHRVRWRHGQRALVPAKHRRPDPGRLQPAKHRHAVGLRASCPITGRRSRRPRRPRPLGTPRHGSGVGCPRLDLAGSRRRRRRSPHRAGPQQPSRRVRWGSRIHHGLRRKTPICCCIPTAAPTPSCSML